MKKHVLFGHQAVTLKASPVPTAHELHLSEYFSLYKNKKSTQGTKKGQKNQKQPEFKANLSRPVLFIRNQSSPMTLNLPCER